VVSDPRRDNLCQFNHAVVLPANQQIGYHVAVEKDRLQPAYTCNVLSACRSDAVAGL